MDTQHEYVILAEGGKLFLTELTSKNQAEQIAEFITNYKEKRVSCWCNHAKIGASVTVILIGGLALFVLLK